MAKFKTQLKRPLHKE